MSIGQQMIVGKGFAQIKKNEFNSTDLDVIYSCLAALFGRRYCRVLITHRLSKASLFKGDLYVPLISIYMGLLRIYMCL